MNPCRQLTRFTQSAITAFVFAATIGVTGCYETSPVDRLEFALTSAEVTLGQNQDFPVNLVFLASPSNKVWDDVSGIDLLQNGRHVSRIDDYVLHAGDDFLGYRVGNIQFSIPPEVLPMRFSHVKVEHKEGKSQTQPVGAWSLGLAATESPISSTDEWPAVLPDCSPVTISVRNNDEQDIVLGDSDDVSVAPDSQPVLFSGGKRPAVLTPVCNPEFDLFVFTPSIVVSTSHQEQLDAPLDPVSIGFAPLASETLQRISDRLAG